ncbi:MAG: Holliday junction resolvase RuvX [Thiotrichales bacterium]|nr:Holliday junction resolvase RuvX [Thiotrichales bacterium]
MPNPDLEGTLLGFDFGLKRIGVAVGQTVTQTASPLAVVSSRDGVPDWSHLKQLIETWQPVAVVVGLPLHLDGSEQALTQSARKFAQRLSGRFHKRLFLIEEQLSSREAEARLGKNLQAVDAHAAQIILENWLQQR